MRVLLQDGSLLKKLSTSLPEDQIATPVYKNRMLPKDQTTTPVQKNHMLPEDLITTPLYKNHIPEIVQKDPDSHDTKPFSPKEPTEAFPYNLHMDALKYENEDADACIGNHFLRRCCCFRLFFCMVKDGQQSITNLRDSSQQKMVIVISQV